MLGDSCGGHVVILAAGRCSRSFLVGLGGLILLVFQKGNVGAGSNATGKGTKS